MMLKDDTRKISMYIRFLTEGTIELSQDIGTKEKDVVFKGEDFPRLEAKILKSIPSMIFKLPYVSSPEEFTKLAYKFAEVGGILVAYVDMVEANKHRIDRSIETRAYKQDGVYEVKVSVYEYNNVEEFKFGSISEIRNKAYHLAKKLYFSLLNAQNVNEYKEVAKLAGTIAGLLLAPEIINMQIKMKGVV